MADRAAGLKICCDEKYGCSLPCPGGLAYRCTTGETTTSGSGDEHMKCSCGQHCGCNPCTSGLRVITPEVGKALLQVRSCLNVPHVRLLMGQIV